MKILIYSTYKSGSTAVYEAIRQSGAAYDTYYEPEDLSQIIFKRKNILCKYLSIQNFSADADIIDSFDKVILLVRNPIDRIISMMHFIPNVGMNFTNDNNAKLYLDLLEQKSSDPDRVSFLEIVSAMSQICAMDFIERHKDVNQGFLLAKERISNLHILRYEEFIAGKTQGLNAFLGANIIENVSLPQNLSIISRTKSQGAWLNWCTPSDLKYFSRAFADFNRSFDYEFIPPAEAFKKTIPHDKSVEYILACINDYRRRYKLPAFDGAIKIGEEGALFDQAQQLFLVGKYGQAERILRGAIQINSELPGLYLFLSRIQERQGDVQGAIQNALKVLQIDQANSHAHVLLAELYVKSGQAEKTLNHGEKAVALDPTNAAAHIQLAHAYNKMGGLEEAITQIKIALDLDSENPFPLAFLAELYLKQNNPKGAETIIRQAIALKPDFPRFHVQLSRALEQNGQLKEARSAMRAALDLDKDNEHYRAFMKKLDPQWT